MAKIKMDGVEYDTDDISEKAKSTASSLHFVNMRLQQLESELAIADTARVAYKNALEKELNQPK